MNEKEGKVKYYITVYLRTENKYIFIFDKPTMEWKKQDFFFNVYLYVEWGYSYQG